MTGLGIGGSRDRGFDHDGRLPVDGDDGAESFAGVLDGGVLGDGLARIVFFRQCSGPFPKVSFFMASYTCCSCIASDSARWASLSAIP